MSEKLTKKVAEVIKDDHHVNGDDRPIETNVHIRTQPKRIPLPANVMVFQTFATMAATKLKASSCRVLMLFFAMSGYENYVGMDVKTIAEDLDMTSRSVISALNELEEDPVNGRDHARR